MSRSHNPPGASSCSAGTAFTTLDSVKQMGHPCSLVLLEGKDEKGEPDGQGAIGKQGVQCGNGEFGGKMATRLFDLGDTENGVTQAGELVVHAGMFGSDTTTREYVLLWTHLLVMVYPRWTLLVCKCLAVAPTVVRSEPRALFVEMHYANCYRVLFLQCVTESVVDAGSIALRSKNEGDPERWPAKR